MRLEVPDEKRMLVQEALENASSTELRGLYHVLRREPGADQADYKPPDGRVCTRGAVFRLAKAFP